MAIVSFLIHLAGAVMLLLFAVRMVRTGIERVYGASFQRVMTTQRSLLQAGIAGVVMAVVLQSSAAVALLASGFSVGGALSFGSGLAIVLGGDLGSALIIQVLTFRLDWLIPFLLAIGGYLFVKVEQRKLRQAGRVLMGIAFILISLRFLREAMDPIRDSSFLPAIAGYLARDYVTAFIVGATLAFVMHSSVAAILMCVTLVQIGAIPFSASLSLVLGANLGSAFIPIWLTRGMPAKARRIPFANMALRGSWAIVALFAVNLGAAGLMPRGISDGQLLIYSHIAFNALLLIGALPFCGMLAGPMARLLPDPMTSSEVVAQAENLSVLEPGKAKTPAQTLADLKRELLRMSGLVESMFRPALALYDSGDRQQIRAIRAKDEDVNNCLTGIRSYVSGLPPDKFSKAQIKSARDMLEYAIRLETAGDVVAKRLTSLADELNRKGLKFSKDGRDELERIHESILANMKLASNVLVSDDLESARLLSLEKTEVKRAERESRKRHLKRLQKGTAKSFETSDVHLETLRAFREFNSHISAIAYPILYENGQLLETRLIEDMPSEENRE